ncbi:MAG: flagellar assembly protein FliW [Planctomycetes bacterium]|nr:flagellar assembly protein FliW [Planctomycetota bacterium]
MGLLGLESIRRFVLVDQPGGGPLQGLQAVEEPALAFIVADPLLFFADYRIPVRAEDLAPIDLTDPSQGKVLVILWVPDDPTLATANLQGPLVLNPERGLARQLVLADGRYATKHRLFGNKPA